MGCKSGRKIDSPLGCFGLNHTHESGLRFSTYLTINNPKVATTFKKKHYAKWIHPRSKKLHQIYHFIVNCQMFHRVIGAGLTPHPLGSDHYAIFMKLHIMKRLKKNIQTRSRILNLDYSILSNPQNRITFCEEELNNIQYRTDLTYTNPAESITKATSNIPVEPEPQPGWFPANKKELSPLIEARNEAMRNVLRKRTRLNTKRLQQFRKKLKTAVKNAKNIWIQLQCLIILIQNVVLNKHGTL